MLSLLILGFLAMFGVMFAAVASTPASDGRQSLPPFGFFLIMWLFFAALYGSFLIPSFIAGYALLKRKRWAKIAAIIAGTVSAMFAPFGTAVSVYTFWFLFSEPGKLLYDTPAQTLPPPPLFETDRDTPGRREFQRTGYEKPPDWR